MSGGGILDGSGFTGSRWAKVGIETSISRENLFVYM